jgi:hypothetical protein
MLDSSRVARTFNVLRITDRSIIVEYCKQGHPFLTVKLIYRRGQALQQLAFVLKVKFSMGAEGG